MSFLIALLLASAVQAFKEPPKVQVCNIALCSKCTKLIYFPSKFFPQNQLEYFELQYFDLYLKLNFSDILQNSTNLYHCIDKAVMLQRNAKEY